MIQNCLVFWINIVLFHLKIILNMLRKSDKPLQQIIRRKVEIDVSLNKSRTHNICTYPQFEKEHTGGPTVPGTIFQFGRGLFSNVTLKINRPDNCCSLKDGSIVLIHNFIIRNNIKFIIGKKFNNCSDFYTKPCSSADLNIYLVRLEDLGPLQSWNVEEINSKHILMNLRDQPCITMPLVHI
ncbi:unnamed protein product [Psylliodes chrysocephalus]|uniref:Uncharacterized protein n=1 Tax=Psylliodes chrysocephalus TaxID=3402493 RepID=A0A9P0CWA6_9CUCU|nr:unnamed protein product [Psylliodes chrysocephala]